MKHIAVFILSIYKLFFSPFLHHVFGMRTICRYHISCSEYTKRAILQKGVIIGVYLGTRRVLSCQPFSKLTYG